MRTMKIFNTIVVMALIGVIVSLAYINQQITLQNDHLNTKLAQIEKQIASIKHESKNLTQQIDEIEENIRPEVRNLQAGLQIH